MLSPVSAPLSYGSFWKASELKAIIEAQHQILSRTLLPSPPVPRLGLWLDSARLPGVPWLPYHSLTSLYDDELLLRRGPSKHYLLVGLEDMVQLFWVHVLKFWAVHYNGFNRPMGRSFQRLDQSAGDSSQVPVCSEEPLRFGFLPTQSFCPQCVVSSNWLIPSCPPLANHSSLWLYFFFCLLWKCSDWII